MRTTASNSVFEPSLCVASTCTVFGVTLLVGHNRTHAFLLKRLALFLQLVVLRDGHLEHGILAALRCATREQAAPRAAL